MVPFARVAGVGDRGGEALGAGRADDRRGVRPVHPDAPVRQRRARGTGVGDTVVAALVGGSARRVGRVEPREPAPEALIELALALLAELAEYRLGGRRAVTGVEGRPGVLLDPQQHRGERSRDGAPIDDGEAHADHLRPGSRGSATVRRLARTRAVWRACAVGSWCDVNMRASVGPGAVSALARRLRGAALQRGDPALDPHAPSAAGAGTERVAQQRRREPVPRGVLVDLLDEPHRQRLFERGRARRRRPRRPPRGVRAGTRRRSRPRSRGRPARRRRAEPVCAPAAHARCPAPTAGPRGGGAAAPRSGTGCPPVASHSTSTSSGASAPTSARVAARSRPRTATCDRTRSACSSAIRPASPASGSSSRNAPRIASGVERTRWRSEQERVAVRPVQVVEHQQQRLAARELAEHGRERRHSAGPSPAVRRPRSSGMTDASVACSGSKLRQRVERAAGAAPHEGSGTGSGDPRPRVRTGPWRPPIAPRAAASATAVSSRSRLRR